MTSHVTHGKRCICHSCQPVERPCFDNGRCVGHERYQGAGSFNLRYCDEPKAQPRGARR